MKAITNCNLNRRIGAPYTTSDLAGYVVPGTEITISETCIGQSIEGNNIWYKGMDGYYYWSGGFFPNVNVETVFSNNSKTNMIQFDPKKMSWGHKWYNIPFIWNDLNTMGRGITIAVIDTGIDDHHVDLISNIHKSSKSFVDNDSSISDIVGHGTKMAGIIGATGKNKVYGVAPECNLLILKASNQESGPDVKPFVDALTYVSSIKEVDIVSFSNVLDNDVNLKGAVEKCINNNKIVIASIGDARDIFGNPDGPDDDTFPACYNNIIAVGSFDQQGKICTFSNWNSHLSFLAPGDDQILTTGLNNSTAMGGQTSIAAALTSGCLALLLSYAKINALQPVDCINAIINTCDDIGTTIGKDIQSGYGRMNLRNAIAKLKKT